MRLNVKLRRDIKFFFIVLLAFTMFINGYVSADDEPDSLVISTFSIEFLTGTNLLIDVAMDAEKLTTDRSYTSSEIASASEEEMGALKYSLYLLLKNQINIIFNGAEISNFEMPIFEDGLFREELDIKLTSSFFKINESINAETLINGVLDMGAVVTYDFDLVAESGWNNTFTFVLPNNIIFKSANTDEVSTSQKDITWSLKWDSLISEKNALLSIKSKNPTTSVIEDENIFLTFNLMLGNVDNVSLSTEYSFQSLNMQNYDVLPSFVTELKFVPSDGIRLFIENGILTWDDFYKKSVKPITQKTISVIEDSSFNQSLKMSFFWDSETSTNCTNPFNITNMDDNPAIKAQLISDSNVRLLFCDISSRAFFGLINAGASANISSNDINFGDSLTKIGQPYEVILHLPTAVYLDGKNLYRWNDSVSPSGLFTSDLQPLPKYSDELIETYVEIKINKIDLNIPSFFTGKTEFTTTTYSKENDILYISKFPNEFDLSDTVEMEFLNSDAFRVCVEESVFDADQIDLYLLNRKNMFETRLSNIFNGVTVKGIVDKDVFLDSLVWDKDISNMDHLSPVIASNYANNIYPIRFDFTFWPPEIHISNQTFNFASIKNQSATYRVIFPKGIIVSATDTLNKSIIKGTINGREYIEISFSSDEDFKIDVVTCSLVATPLYLLVQFLPCIISFVLVIVLLIVLYLFRKKRKGKVHIIKEDSSTSYEGEDFYVPPPPSSK